jgi:organic hydroperoxide reductase OsmC/OhrA
LSSEVQNIEDENELEVIEEINAEQEQIENGDEEEEVLAGTSLHISSARKEAHENLNKQATRMKMISDATHLPVDVEGNVILPIPDVDRAKADLRNVVGVVLERNEDSV